MSSDKIQNALLGLLSNALFQKPYIVSADTDLEKLYEESLYQAVPAVVYSSINKDILPEKLKDKWELGFDMELLRNSKISYGHSLVHQIFSAASIDYVILKGCVSASYYPTPMVRKLGDVDFLVSAPDFDKAKSVLLDNGFKLINSNHEYEVEFKKDGVIYELHRRINGIPDNKLGAKIDKYFDDIFDKSELVSTEFATYMEPSVFHHGLVMLLHVARHMITGGIGLRHLCDWAVFVNEIGKDFSGIFEKTLRSIGLWCFAQVLTQLCVEFIGCPAQDWSGHAQTDLLDALRDDIFVGGNFGKKDLNRADEAKFITSRKDGGVSGKSNLSQTITSANEIVRRHWKWTKNVPFVYPIGWIYFGARYGVKASFGKRKIINVKELVNSADKRKEIYRQLRLFE